MGWVIGVDEVGRGPLAGPVVTAAVMAERREDGTWPVLGVRDSKKLSPEKRVILFNQLQDSPYVGFAYAQREAVNIDHHGIKHALGSCFKDCIGTLLHQCPGLVEAVLIDGSPLWSPEFLRGQRDIPVRYIIRGDDSEWVIGAASILAKVFRDSWMTRRDKAYPGYGWDRNMGYGTEEHIAAINRLGFTPEHRKSFCSAIKGTEDSIFDMFGTEPG